MKGWNERNLDGQAFPFVLVDAIVIKIREDGRVRPHSVLIAIGINELGHREILGMQIGNSETEASWTEFFNPEYYRKKLRTTNSVERLNEEIRRRERVIRIFPNSDSALCLIDAILIEKHEEWSAGRRYFDMKEYWVWKNKRKSTGKIENRISA